MDLGGGSGAAQPSHAPMDWEPDLLRADVVDRKYAGAIVTAAAACAEDTAGQTCFICMDGAEEEGLVRGCACRGGNGFAHVSCLARQAQVEVEQDSTPSHVRAAQGEMITLFLL